MTEVFSNKNKNSNDKRYINNDTDKNTLLPNIIISSKQLNKFSILQWNIRGYTGIDRLTHNDKTETLSSILLDIEPDIICFQEARIHYEWRANPNTSNLSNNHNKDNSLPPPKLYGYFTNVGGKKSYDNYHKNIIYIKQKYYNYTQIIDIPNRNTTETDKENHHWIKWILIHPHKSLYISNTVILLGSYYRSPNKIQTGYDLLNISLDIKYIYQNYPNIKIKTIFICGDFNIHHPNISLSSTNHYSKIDINEFDILSDIMVKYNLHIINHKEVPTYDTNYNGKRTQSVLDLSIASQDLIQQHYEWCTLDMAGSDHKPILSTFYTTKSLPSPNNTIKNKIQIVKNIKYKFYAPIDIEVYKETIRLNLKKIRDKYQYLHKDEKCEYQILDDIAYDYYNIIKKAGIVNIGLISNICKKRPWSTFKTIQICKRTQQFYKRWKRTKKQRFYDIYKKLRKKRNIICTAAKKAYIDKLRDKLNRYDQDWWKTVNVMRGFNAVNLNKIPFLKTNDDILLYNDYDKANTLNKMYCSYNNYPQHVEYKKVTKLNFKKIPEIPKQLYPMNINTENGEIKNPNMYNDMYQQQQNNKLNETISIEEIISTVNTFKPNKNPGPGLHIKLLQIVLSDIAPFLHWLFNLFLVNMYLPRLFKIRYIKPIIKPSKDPHLLTNYRQISMFGSTGKIYEKIISIRLSKYVIKNKLISDYTMGFLKSKSTTDTLSILCDDIYTGFDRQIPTYAVFFDIISCYDVVHYDILMNRLNKYYGIKGRILNVIADFFQNCWTRTIVNNIGSDWLVPIKGLGQGRPGSPIFNLLYIDPLHSVIIRPQLFRLIIFADDIILYTILSFNYANHIQEWIQIEIDNITRWLNKQKMKLSIPKTKYKIFYNTYIKRKDKNIIRPPELFLYDTKIVYYDKPIKYLGYYLSHNLNKLYHINHIIKKANYALHLIQIGFKNIKNVNINAYFLIIKSCVMQIIYYCDIFLLTATQKELNILNIFYNKILRYLCGARRHTPIDEILLFTGDNNIYDTIEIHAAIYWYRLLHLPNNNPLYHKVDKYWFQIWKNQTPNNIITNTKSTLKTYERKSILWTCFNVAKKYELLNVTNFGRYKHYHLFFRLFKYMHIKAKIPEYLVILYEPFQDYNKYNINKNTIYIYTDGSLKNALGGYGIYCEFYQLNSNNFQPIIIELVDEFHKFIGYCTDINFIELLAINESLIIMITYNYKIINKYDYIHIVTDNEQAFNWIAGNDKINESFIFDLILNIYNNINNIYDKYNIKTKIQWCSGHKWIGNDNADKLAKLAITEQKSNYTKASKIIKTTPISRKTIRNLFRSKILSNQTTNNLQTIHVISNNLNQWNIFTLYDKHHCHQDLEILSKLSYMILTQLRTGHIRLNGCVHMLQHHDYYKKQFKIHGQIIRYLNCNSECCLNNNSGICTFCVGKFENIHHFIMDCVKYNKSRYILYCQCMPILNYYHINFNLKNLLFLPISMSQQHRKQIYDLITRYVMNTKRLKFTL